MSSLISRLGPGLITGAADDDPGGIATYSQAGAEFRYSLVWTLFLTWPLMVGIQMLSARVGWATGTGLAKNIDRMCPRWLTVSLVGVLPALKFLPDLAGLQLLTAYRGVGLLDPIPGGLVMAAWAVGLVALAALALHRRDA